MSAIVCCFISSVAMGSGTAPRLTFWKGNGGLDASCGTLNGATRADYFLGHGTAPVSNDEARSVTLQGIPAGTRLILCDSRPAWSAPQGHLAKTQDDIALIEVLRYVGRYVVGTFEASFDDGRVRQRYLPPPRADSPHFWKGLDGKVSIIRVFPPGTALPPAQDFCDV